MGARPFTQALGGQHGGHHCHNRRRRDRRRLSRRRAGLLGCKLRLHDRDEARLADLRARGGIEVEGERSGFAAIERVTTNTAEAVEGADVIVIVTGGTYHEGAARDIAPSLRDGQTILLI